MSEETTTAVSPPVAPAVTEEQEIEKEAREMADIELAESDDSAEDDEAPDPTIAAMRLAEQRSTALKPVSAAALDLYSRDADKVAARAKLTADYKAAYEAKPNGIEARYKRADAKFRRAANDMKPRVDAWIKKWLNKDDDGLRKIFKARRQIEARLASSSGDRESKRDQATATATRWQKAHADWSAPHARVDAILTGYEDKIDKLNADINTDNEADLAIYEFWFQVAPKHLQLRATPLGADYPTAGEIENRLQGFPEFADFLKPGRERADGSIFLIAPGQPLERHRKVIFVNLRRVGEEQAKREADYLLRPDDAASLKKARDTAIQRRAADVKELLKEPKAG